VQILKDGTVPFDDVEVARENLKASGYECESATNADAKKKTA
jgi:hypothetical protein